MEQLNTSVVFNGNQGQKPDAAAKPERSISDVLGSLAQPSSSSGASSDGDDHWSGH